MSVSKGRWKLFRHLALFNRLALAFAAGAILNLLIEIPPQHGKSQFWSRYFPAWLLGTCPDLRVILTSYEAGYAASWGRATRDVLEEHGQRLFDVKIRQDSHAADEWQLQGHEGGMVTAGVGGPITGRPADLAIVDDPLKNAEEASSAAHKAKIWDWWDSTLCTRVHEGGRRLVLMTRWAEDDLIGRIKKRAKETGEPWTSIRLPALAEEDEIWPEWGWNRSKGQVLCPELYSQATMESRRDNTLAFWWATMYQQRPYPREGGEMKSGWFEIVDEVPKLDIECRAWDMAASESHDAKQSAGARMGRLGWDAESTYYITDFKADWWSSGTRDRKIRETAEADGKGVRVILEQEPGSGGKAQVNAIAGLLSGWRVVMASAATGGSKMLRAEPLASAAQASRVKLKRGPWNEAFLEQIRSFPGGKLVDMVDAAAHGFNWLSSQKKAQAPFMAEVNI